MAEVSPSPNGPNDTSKKKLSLSEIRGLFHSTFVFIILRICDYGLILIVNFSLYVAAVLELVDEN